MERGVTMRIQVSEKSMKAVLFYISEEEVADKKFMNSLNPYSDYVEGTKFSHP